MEIRCIALDLDRTTLNERARLSDGNRRALEYALSKGVHIVIASGRGFASLPEDVTAIPGIEYAVTSNGASVYHVPTGTRLKTYALTPQSVRAVLSLTAGERLAYEAFLDGAAYAPADYVEHPERYGVGKAAPYIRATRTPVTDFPAFLEAHMGELESMDLVTVDEPLKQAMWALLRERVPDLYVTSSAPQLLELTHRDGGKHSGVRFVAERLGLSPDQIAAFGDGDNDVDLLRFAGRGIAVANATPACLAAADAVTLDHREDGVAHGIYQLLEL